ncbi:hypothetical protein PLESTM_001766500 [Pleodorina starrii]|nr:hypothetical protein PLESTM_001766500 [Pleodorina starrii]
MLAGPPKSTAASHAPRLAGGGGSRRAGEEPDSHRTAEEDKAGPTKPGLPAGAVGRREAVAAAVAACGEGATACRVAVPARPFAVAAAAATDGGSSSRSSTPWQAREQRGPELLLLVLLMLMLTVQMRRGGRNIVGPPHAQRAVFAAALPVAFRRCQGSQLLRGSQSDVLSSNGNGFGNVPPK